ncbi:MAG: 3'-5' exonuclease [Proteobacteria bacterium]|nr:3'-5' exonuclease [Pseudomonadota bacterium]
MAFNNWPALWFDMPLAVFDLETTGLDPQSCEIIEVGIVQFYRGEVIKQFDWFVDPECEIPEQVVKLTHITQEDVTGQPKLREIVPDILKAFEGHGIVAYNIAFDKTVLTHKLEALGKRWPSANPILDPLIFAEHFYPNQGNKLGMVSERLGVSLEGAHRACNDAEATGKVLYAFRDRLPPDLETLLLLQAQWEREIQERRQRWRRPTSGADSELSALMSKQASATKGLSIAFAYAPETDPLRALYANVPNAAPRSKPID